MGWLRVLPPALVAAAACMGSTSLTIEQSAAPVPSTSGEAETQGVPSQTSLPPGPVSPGPTVPPYTVVGRVSWPDESDPNAFVSSWAGTSIGVRFSGTGLRLVVGDGNISPWSGSPSETGNFPNFWDVVVDGVALSMPLVDGHGPTERVVASGLAPGPHEIWITRRTEGFLCGRVAVSGLAVEDGALLPPPAARSRRIEVLGTSVETGLHVGATADDPNEAEFRGCPYTAPGQNQNKAWPKLVAEGLEAELMNTSLMGAGLVLGFTASRGIELPDLYPRADTFLAAPVWDATAFIADVVLVVAGWSDANLTNPNDPATAARLTSAYVSLLQQIRGLQPVARLYAVVRCSDAPDNNRSTMAAIIAQAVATRQRAGDALLAVLTLPPWSAAAANCNDHPNWAQQQALADAALPVIRADMGW